MNLRVMIVEDEPLARRFLQRCLNELETITVVASVATVADAREALSEWSPDLVFLDIGLPDQSGLEFAMCLPPTVSTVFTTAYDQHAIQAFELGAVDYLLKPFDSDRVALAIERARLRPAGEQDFRACFHLLEGNLAGSIRGHYIFIKESNQVRRIELAKILRISAEQDYVMVHLETRHHLTRMRMKSVESALKGRGFIRVHRSHLINLAHLVRMSTAGNGRKRLHLSNGECVISSRAGSQELKSAISGC